MNQPKVICELGLISAEKRERERERRDTSETRKMMVD
jgi:hypothetical protein